MRNIRLPAGIGLAVLAAAGYALYRSTQLTRDRRAPTPGAKPEALQTWEDEGGAVPVAATRTAGQVYAPSADHGS